MAEDNGKASEGAEPSAPQNGNGGQQTSAAVKEAPSQLKPGLMPPYKVLLHNDDVNVLEDVIKSILKVTSLSLEDAQQKTLEAHEAGVALLLVTHKERAELYVEQFTTFNLTVTIEPDTA
jgi:ATP-dependent Clp protease adaptor protein ClpS